MLASDLHAELKITSRFRDWVRSCQKVVGEIERKPTESTGGRPFLDAVLTDTQVKDIRKWHGKSMWRGKPDREHGALCTIEQLLGITLQRQYQCGSYRIDGYCVETNTAYEIDEEQHFIGGELRQECVDRQKWIEEQLGCVFVRIKV